MFAPNTTGLPNTGDYVIGRGKAYISEINTTTGKPTGGWRDIGNVTAFTVTRESEEIEHFSSREGTKTLDKSVVLQTSATLGFTVDELNAENVAAWLSGEKASYTNAAIAGFAERTLVSSVVRGRHYDIEDANGGRAYDVDPSDLTVEVLPAIDALTASGGRTLQFVASSKKIIASSGSFVTDGWKVGHKIAVSGTSDNNGTVTIAVVTALEITVSEALVDEGPSSSGATLTPADTPLVADTDYELDTKMGRLFFYADSDLVADGDAIKVTLAANANAAAVTEVRAMTTTTKLVAVKFIGENPANNDKQAEIQFHQVNLKADGEMALIGDEFATMPFTGGIERNELADPDAPYFRVRTHANS
ncbi:MAG: hypothetical protein LC123_02365 [Burkholderiales bacterium]|nr:hypothetical protein [Burkholderiales bacterium]